MKKGEWDPILPDGVRIQGIIHNRLKHIKEIIEGPKDPRPGGIPRPGEKEKAEYLTIYITTITDISKDPKVVWGDQSESNM